MKDCFEVTIRDNWGDKIVRRHITKGLDTTIGDILREHRQQTSMASTVDEFIKKHGRENLKFFWRPDLIPVPPPPPPKPETIGFEVLVNECGV